MLPDRVYDVHQHPNKKSTPARIESNGFVQGTVGLDVIREWADFDTLKAKSQILANAVDQAILGLEEIGSLHITEIAASIIVLSSDLGS